MTLLKKRFLRTSVVATVLLSSLFGERTISESCAQENRLTIERIFNSSEFSAKRFSVNWMPEGGNYFVQEPAADGKGNDIVLIDPQAEEDNRNVLIAAKNLIPEGQSEPIAIESFQVSPDENKVLVFNNTKRVWRYNTRGDYWVADLASGTVRKLGGDKAAESSLMFAKFSPDSKYAAYVRERNVYVEDLANGRITQVTETENDDIINGTSDWVYEEELDLRDGFQWSDDGNQIVFWRFDTSQVGVFTMINNTDELYPRLIKFQYPKVGTTNSAVSIGIYDMAGGETKFVDLPGDPRENYPARVNWVPNSNEFLLQRFNRLQNTNTVYAVDATTAKFRTVFEDKDDAWAEVCDWIQWWPDGKHFTFISERDGWKHVYLANVDTGELDLLTPGNFDVIELYQVNQQEQACYFQASPDDSKTRYLYRQSFGQPQLKRLTPADMDGWNDYSFAADGSSAVHTWSKFGVPPKISTVSLPDHKVIAVKQANSDLVQTMKELAPNDQEFFQIDIDDGNGGQLMIDAYVMRPTNFDASKKYPALVYVYGEPWGTTVTDNWDTRQRYLWHRMLCEQGYAVFSFDNRGAKCPRGTAFRKAIYKKIGIINASDQAAAMRATMQKFDWIDEQRVGMWGWSGGGSSTLNALFQYPDLYQTGISIAPVPDQRYYDTIYQERYMQTPDLNPTGFKNGSPITHAGNLKGNLLVIHGTGDDNCHYQTMELLINKLIASDKQFEMFAYPNRSHGIYEYENTTPHLRKLMTNFLLEHLPPNPGNPADENGSEPGANDDQAMFQIEKTTAPELAEVLPKQIDVFGVKVLGTTATPDAKMRHAAIVLAEYLDNDEDGNVDNADVVSAMTGANAAIIMTRDEDELERLVDKHSESAIDAIMDRWALQALWAEETIPGGAEQGRFDATLEEVLHLVTHEGYSRIYPEVFGERPKTKIAEAMDLARGGHFKDVPRRYPEAAWYTYDDETCDYGCQITEYFYWGLTSKLGGQEFPGRLEEIQHEWRLNTDAKLKAGDPALYSLLSEPQYKLPTRLPDGKYRSAR